jgi:putative MATE family efflux protein
MNTAAAEKDSFFLHNKQFYKTFFSMMILLVLQNIITYTVNVADNIMLGGYSQTALSAAAACNQIQYILQQLTVMGLGEGIVILSSQYWGRGDTDTIQRISGTAITIGLMFGVVLTVAAFLVPDKMVALFTDDPAIIRAGVSYLSIIRYTYLIFIITNLILSVLRSVQVVRIAFILSCIELVINASINYCLIYGHFGFPEMGIHGAAIGTLTANITGLVILLIYCQKSRQVPMRLQLHKMFQLSRTLLKQYLKVSLPCVVSSIVFASAVAIQTVIFGHLSSDALAASGVAGTFFQYVKMIPVGAASASSVLVGKVVGTGKLKELHQLVHSLQGIYLAVGCVACLILLALRYPVLSLYKLTDTAYSYAVIQMMIQAFITIAMAFQMPEQTGIIRGGGDTRYSMISDIIYSWIIVVPMGLVGCFLLRWPFWAVVLWLNIDQILKCFSVTYKVHSYTWVKHLA